MACKSQDSLRFPSLLLIQQQAAVARALSRYLSNYYSEVVVADSPESAEDILGAMNPPPTHVVCGQYFGPDRPRGQELLTSWRGRYPGIRRAVLATGAEDLAPGLDGIDGVYQKPAPLSGLLTLLGLSKTDSLGLDPGSHQPHTTPMESKMNAKNPQAHQLSTLKERLNDASKQEKQPGRLRSAQGFASV